MATEIETTRTEHPHIVMTPGVCGGRPRIDGTRISVEFIARFVNDGVGAEKIVESYPHLTLAGVYSAISYYYDHKEELDAAIEEHSLEQAVERGEIEIAEGGRIIFKGPPVSG
ncbi:MAG: DUF433 domain-containing protein [Chloroflexi bacterium]|nr:DUF433 domain-containing protein [Chloroflexota bacterium]